MFKKAICNLSKTLDIYINLVFYQLILQKYCLKPFYAHFFSLYNFFFCFRGIPGKLAQEGATAADEGDGRLSP